MSAAPRTPAVVIPSRLAATRLPRKPLAEIAGEPMIVHVWRRASAADIGPVTVACADAEIADAVTNAGGNAVLTSPDHASGSDRVHEAIEQIDPERRFDAVVNIQGDLPTLPPEVAGVALKLLADERFDITTLACPIADEWERSDSNVVKAVVSVPPGEDHGRALYFTRATAPSGEGPLFHHIGIYAYRRDALARFVGLPPAPLERRECLEQLRALEAGMAIGVGFVDTAPLGVDTPAELRIVRERLERRP